MSPTSYRRHSGNDRFQEVLVWDGGVQDGIELPIAQLARQDGPRVLFGAQVRCKPSPDTEEKELVRLEELR